MNSTRNIMALIEALLADGGELAVQHASDTAFAAGDRVDVSFAPEAVTVAPRG